MNSEENRAIRVIFVCMGNICRSPSAEIVFRHLVEKAGLGESVAIDSAGTIGCHTGCPPDRRMAAALRARGYEIKGSARQVESTDFERFDLLIPMDRENEADLLGQLCPSAEHAGRIRPFVGFCNEHEIDFVPDPYYGGPEGFERVADIVEDGCSGLLEHLRGRMNER